MVRDPLMNKINLYADDIVYGSICNDKRDGSDPVISGDLKSLARPTMIAILVVHDTIHPGPSDSLAAFGQLGKNGLHAAPSGPIQGCPGGCLVCANGLRAGCRYGGICWRQGSRCGNKRVRRRWVGRRRGHPGRQGRRADGSTRGKQNKHRRYCQDEHKLAFCHG